MSLASELAAYSAQVNADVSSQTDPNSIDPTTVGSIGIDLANIIEPYISVANNQTIYEGTSDPTTLPSFGADLDLFYYKQSSFFALYRKESGIWTLKTTVPFGVVLPNGPATLRTFIDGTTAYVTPGGWFISNTVYNKATQTVFAIPAADTNFYRTDLIYANTANQILYLAGTPAVTPVDPAVPVNSIAVDYVIVPSSSSGFDPYLRFGGSGVNNISAGDVILNQIASPQPADFNISGTGKFDAALGVETTIDSLEVRTAATDGSTATTMNANGLAVSNTVDLESVSIGADFLQFENNGFQGQVVAPAMSADKTWTLPVSSGTLALAGNTSQASSGALTYLGISVVDASHVNIGACTGYIVDNETNPLLPTVTTINYAGELNKLVTTVGSGLATYVLLNSLGVIVFQNTFPTSAQRKTHIYLSKISHPFGAITVAGDEVDFILSPLMQGRDWFQAIGYINNGVVPSSNGATLTFKTSTGIVTGDGINFVLDNTNPNDLTIAAQTPCVFLPRTQTGSGGGATSTVDVGNYDVAGVITAIPGGPNVCSNRYIFLVPGLGYIVQYGQVTYPNITDATAAVGKEAFVVYPSLVRNAIMVGVLSARKGATDLSNTADGRFFASDKFGQLIGAQAGISLSTLQTAYGNSLQPQIVTTASLGAVQFKRGSAADTDNVLQVLNGAGTATFGITGEGIVRNSAGRYFFGLGSLALADEKAVFEIRNSSSFDNSEAVLSLTTNFTAASTPLNADVKSELRLNRGRGTESSPSVVLSGDGIGEVDFCGYRGDRYFNSARLECEAAGNFSLTSTPTILALRTTPTGTAATVRRLVINENGFVTIGDTVSTDFKLRVDGNIGPDATNTRDFGSSIRYWNNAYLTNYFGEFYKIGTNTPSDSNNGAVIVPTYTASTGYNGLIVEPTFAPTATVTTTEKAFKARLKATLTGQTMSSIAGAVIGIDASVNPTGTGIINTAVSIKTNNAVTATGLSGLSIDNLVGGWFIPISASSDVVLKNQLGVLISETTFTTTATSKINLMIRAGVGSNDMDLTDGLGDWSIYNESTRSNYLQGNTGIGTATTTASFLTLGASTTAKSQLNLIAGTAPTTPNNGDIWFDGTNLKMRVGGVTKTFTLV